MDPALLGLSEGAGVPPSKAFATLPGCRALPGASVSLVSAGPSSSPSSSSSKARSGDDEEEVLEVRPPPGGGGKALRLQVLDGVSLRVR